jgi:hypothetical protein
MQLKVFGWTTEYRIYETTQLGSYHFIRNQNKLQLVEASTRKVAWQIEIKSDIPN